MANSVVRVTDVTDDMISDSLLLLVGEDGTVTPDQRTVENYLNRKNGPTNLQIMHIEKSDHKGIDVSVDNVTYMPGDINIDNVVEDIVIEEESKSGGEAMDEVARILYAFRLDHDYTPLTSPKRNSPSPTNLEDELAKTLSILHGSEDVESSKTQKNAIDTRSKPSEEKATSKPVISKDTVGNKKSVQKVVDKKVNKGVKTKPRVIHTKPTRGRKPAVGKSKRVESDEEEETSTSETSSEEEEESLESDSSEEEEVEEEEEEEDSDDESDSDFDIEEEIRTKKGANLRTRSKSESKPVEKPKKRVPPKRTPSRSKVRKEKIEESAPKQETKVETKEEKEKTEETIKNESQEKPSEDANSKPDVKSEEAKLAEKKQLKKEKKPPKPIPNDFALFSTPDIIRTVGGKKPHTPGTPGTPETPKTPYFSISPKPAKITQESRSKSSSESRSDPPTPLKQNRHSTELKQEKEKDKDKHPNHQRTSTETKHTVTNVNPNKHKEKDRRVSLDKEKSVEKSKRVSLDEKSPEQKHPTKHENKKSEESFTSNATPMETNNSISETTTDHADPNNINLDATGLDLDQSILDNINNDMISEDILYQVAQQLVSNPELQNAIDKGINEGVLDTSAIEQPMEIQQVDQRQAEQNSGNEVIKQGTQIVRPDGRIVVIPPIERPTTRSRNKKSDEEVKVPFKNILKPLDDEHVSGNELDSSNDEEEESEDDPNKLWCLCNQPHNNRFMICCDSCEEWYHGKCVNITKAMGQQMESEGKEWICLFCKDSNLRRPKAAAKRIRKASRNSRTSSDSSSSAKKPDSSSSVKKVDAGVKKPEGQAGKAVPCVVCQKPSRKSSIYCSEGCILTHAQGIERVVVFERSTGTMLTGNKAPSAANLEQWLKEHPGFEVVRSAKKMIHKPGPLTQSRLKLVKNSDNEGVSLAVQKKGVNVGLLKHGPKTITVQQTKQGKTIKYYKIFTKHPNSKEPRTKLIQPQPIPAVKPTQNVPTNVDKANITPVKVQKVITTVTPKTPKLKEKEAPPKEKTPKTPKNKPEVEKATPPPKQENIRENVQKTVFEQLIVRLKSVEDIKLSEEEVKNISIEIESQLYKCFGDTGQKYKNKYRSLIFNIKDVKNQTLWRRICEKSISPYELVRLSPDDMASQELAIWREREAKHQLDMIKKSELELLNCNRQYVLKTHKGEQVLEDNRPDKTDNAEVIKSLMEGSSLEAGDRDRRGTSRDKDRDRTKSGSKHSHRDRDRDRHSSKDRKDRHHRSSSRDKDRHKRSRSRDRSRHKDKKREKRSRSRSKEREKERDRYKKSHKSSKHKKDSISTTEKLDKKSKEILEQLVDNKIVPPLEDRLWKHVPQEDIVPGMAPADSDSDHEPSSTVTIPTPPQSQEVEEYQPTPTTKTPAAPDKVDNAKLSSPEVEEGGLSPPPKNQGGPQEIWRGTINMIDVAQISITAHEVSGDCSGLGKELPENLDIVGRISPETVWDYIGKMKCSNSKIISLVRLVATNIEEKMPYIALYSYLSSRTRLGVVKSTNKAVKDFYILPLAPQKPIPQALLPLNGPGFEELRPALLLGIIVRDKRKRPLLDMPTTTTPKRVKVDVAIAPPARSYTPPPLATPPPPKDPRVSKMPLPPPPLPPTAAPDIVKPPPPPLEEEIEGGDEPYSPEDSDPDSGPIIDSVPPESAPTQEEAEEVQSAEVVEIPDDSPERSPEYPQIPGLGDTPIFPSSKQDLERQMEELNKKIEMQKSEITNITKNIATVATGTDIAGTALASIALPSNLQQILDSIKTIGTSSTDSTDLAQPLAPVADPAVPKTDLTIPLLIPKKPFARAGGNPPPAELSSDTIPLNLPNKNLVKPPFVPAPEKSSVLSSLSEEDLIRKAEEMLGNQDKGGSSPKRAKMDVVPSLLDKDDRVL